MRRVLFLLVLLLAGWPAHGAQDPEKAVSDELTRAVDRLASASSYRWVSTLRSRGSELVVTDGKAMRDGFTLTTRQLAGSTSRAVRKGDITVVEQADGHWENTTETQARLSKLYGYPNPPLVYARTPLEEIRMLLPHLEDWVKAGDQITARINEAGVAVRYRAGKAFQITKTERATATFRLRAGTLTSYTLHFNLAVRFLGKDEIRDQSVAVELNGIGTTRVEVPSAAREILERSK